MRRDASSPDDAHLRSSLAAVLSRFPALRAVVPANFPTDPRYKITIDRMQDHFGSRNTRFFHRLNLPFALYGHGYFPDTDVRDLLGSLLSELDRFSARFANVPGMRSLLSPLWKNPWPPRTDAPEIWSIASCVYLALNYDTAEPPVPVLGFERLIGQGPRDADLTLQLNGVTRFDVVAYHQAVFHGRTDDEIRVDLATRAERKAQEKFRDLPAGETGVVGVVVVISEADADRQFEKPGLPMRIPGMSNALWIPLRLVSVRAPQQKFIIVGL